MDRTQAESQLTEVVKKVQAGEANAQGELITLTQERLFKFCLLLGHNRELAEDLCQESFIRAIQNIQKLKNPETFIGWLYQIAKNLFIDTKRSAANKEFVSDESVKEVGQASNMDLILNVQRTLQIFDPDERLLLLLIELEGYSYKEAGDLVGLSEDAVRSKLHRLKGTFIKNFK